MNIGRGIDGKRRDQMGLRRTEDRRKKSIV
jgi:hypothetical protein